MANKRVGVTLDINADISQIRTAATEMQKIFSSINLDGKNSAGITKLISNLDKALIELEQKSNTALSGLGDSNAVEKSIGKVNGIINSLIQEFQQLGKNAPKDLAAAVQGFSDKMAQATQFQKDYAAAIRKTESEAKDLGKVQADAIDKVDAAQKKYDATLTKQLQKEKEIADLRKQVEDRNKSKDLGILRKNQLNYQQQVEDAKSAIKQIAQEYENIRINKSGLINGQDIEKLSADDLELYRVYAAQLESMGPAAQEAKKALEDYNAETARISKSADSSQKDLDKINDTLSTQASELDGAKDKLKKATEAINQFNEAGKKADAFDELKNKLAGLFGDDSLKNVKNIDELKNALEQLATTAGGDVASKIRQAISALGQTEGPLNRSAAAARKTGESFKKMSEAEQEINHLTSRLKYFFSLAGGFQLMRRAIRSAVDTTKELDAVMTQTAVVSDYSVGDMWKTLPQYSKYAKQLGAEIKDVYSAQTLYVQQGLNMNDAMDLGIETLKMARVAGIDAAEATNSMTAALRGFNMELTETSAVRINDVYSKLAQNTASNVQEISTAMSKVAALANSANMSFENTSAFLATIIESTREGAETAGTALKTVIARFTEVKKLYDQGELTGTDEEGQEVDVNKISKALRTAGINMNDFFTGAKGLDEIFMELGSKWDSLTTVQQRYIATMAAGSRQQSRFLALMQNYSRTVELTTMAYNSAGSGQEQFEKTLDSLEAKLNQLKAAWDTFTMGIANSDFIKGVIDVGTQILETINKIINAISGGSGAVKSVLSLAAAFGAFKIGGAIFKGGLGKISQMISIGANKGGEKPKNFIEKYQQVKTRTRNRIIDTKEGFKYSAFRGGKNRQALLEAAEQGKLEAKAKQKAYDQALKDYEDKSKNPDYNTYIKYRKQGQSPAEAKESAKRESLDNAENELKIANKNAGKSAEETTKAIQQYGAAMQAAGVAAGILAGLLTLVANKLEETGNTKAASAIKGIATGFGVLSTALTLCGTMFMAFGAAAEAGSAMATAAIESIPFIGWAAAIISALVAVISIISALVETSEEKMARLENETKAAQEAANQASQAYDNLLQGRDKYEELLTQIQSLTKGTQEYRDTLLEINQLVHDLSLEYPDLEYTFEDGMLKILNWDEAVEKANKRKNDAANTAYFADLNERTFKTQQEIDKASAFVNKNVMYGSGDAINPYETNTQNALNNRQRAAAIKLTQGEVDTIFWNSYKEILGAEKFENYSKGEYNINYDEAKEISAAYTKNLQTALEPLIDTGLTDLDKQYQNAVFMGSGQTETDYIVSKFVTADQYQQNLKEGRAATRKANNSKEQGSEDWKEWDLGHTIEGRDQSRWQDIISNAYASGAITEADYIRYKGRTNFTENATNEELYQKLTGKTPKEAGVDYQGVVNYLGQYWEGLEAQKYLDTEKEKFESLDINWQKALNTLTTKPEDLTIDQQKILQDNWKNIVNKLDLSEEISDFYKTIIDNVEWEGTDYLKKQGSYTRAAEKQWKNFEQYDFGETYEDLFRKIEDKTKLSREQKDTVLSVLNSADITSIDDLWKTFDILKESGIDLERIAPELYNSFKGVINVLDESGIAIKKWTKDNATEAIKNARGLANEIQENQSRNFTEANYNTLKELLKSTGNESELNNFIEQTDGSYKYVGDSLSSIINILNAIAGKIPDEYSERKQAEKALSDYVVKSLSSRFNTEFSKENLNNLSDEDKVELYNQVAAGEGKGLFQNAGLAIKVDDSTIGKYWDEFLRLAFENEDITEQFNDSLQRESLIGASSAQLATASLGNGYNEENQRLAGRVLETAIEEENLTDVVIRDTEWLEKNTEALKGNVKEQKAVKQAIKVNADTAKKAEKNFDDLTQTIKDSNEALKSKDPLTRQKALDSIAKSARKAFGDNKKITAKFVNDNEKAFTDFANGVEGAEGTIREALTKDLASDLNLTEAEANQLSDILQTMSDTPVSVDGTADFTSIIQALADVMGSAEEAAALLQSLGYSITWVEDGTVHDSLTGLDMATNYKVLVSDGAGNAVNRNRTAGGGGGGGGKKEFKNDFDKYYNMVEDINELNRLRNLLETDYNQLLASEATNGKQIYDNLKKQVDLLKERRNITADLAEKRKQQILDAMQDEQYSDLGQYAWWNNEDQTVEINWSLINDVKDSELGDRIQEYVSVLEGFQSKYDEQIEALEEIESTLQEIEKRGRDQYISLEDRIRDALIKQIQDRIDELSASNEGINTANQNLLQSIQDTLSLQRQERENAKTEEELTNKEQRLAYLQQDSSGANALEITKLQEEIADARQNYTDSLIDQKINELQEQNDKAAEQRQEQIDLMQQSLDWQEKNGQFWEQAYEIMNSSLGPNGDLVKGSQLEVLLKQGEGWKALSEEGQMKWLKELETQVAEATAYLAMTRQLEDIGISAGKQIAFTNAEGQTLTGKVDKNGNVVVTNADGSTTTYKDVYQSYDGTYHTMESEKDAKTESKPTTSTQKPPSNSNNISSEKTYKSTKTYEGFTESASSTVSQENADKTAMRKAINSAISTWTENIRKTKEAAMAGAPQAGMGQAIQEWTQKINIAQSELTKYKTGGLNTKTGPAWLDGTPSKPELILNARDTQNFIELKDTLAAIKNSGDVFGGNSNYYDIDIQVDQMSSDYDVDRAIERLRNRINEINAYRNVNNLSRLR